MNIGERVGDYEVVEVLGAGGMGQVYKVRNVLSERIEAMKVLLPNMGGDPELAERFLREIKVQAALDHPNIARLHTAQQAGDQFCMIMEFVEGQSIEELLHQGPIGLRDAVSYISQVLDALGYAHAHGVVHRDIKPGNIMRTPNGTVKLMDFGIARMKADRRLTQSGHTVGSLYYMSPEQIKGGEPDPRSDLYSLGVTMYEMVTGRKPFQGDSDYSIMAAHLQQTPTAPIEVVPGVPTDVSEIIVMAMSKDPAGRFQTADAFRHALQNVVAGPAAAPAPSPLNAPTRIIASPPPPMPMPPPVYTAPPPPPMPPPVPAAGSRRGLYMALGSIATLLVIGAAVIEGPKLLRTRAEENKPVEVAQPSPTPAPTPAPVPAAEPTPTPAPVTEPTPAPAPVEVPSQPAPVAAAKTKTKPPVSVNRIFDPQQPQAAAPTQVVATPVPTPAPPQQQAPAPAPAQTKPAVNPQLNELRQQYNDLAIRTATDKNGLRSIQQQMARQGLNLRSDILEAESRMDYQMKEAMDYIRNGDADQARTSLQMAQRAAESIEKFLGR